MLVSRFESLGLDARLGELPRELLRLVYVAHSRMRDRWLVEGLLDSLGAAAVVRDLDVGSRRALELSQADRDMIHAVTGLPRVGCVPLESRVVLVAQHGFPDRGALGVMHRTLREGDERAGGSLRMDPAQITALAKARGPAVRRYRVFVFSPGLQPLHAETFELGARGTEQRRRRLLDHVFYRVWAADRRERIAAGPGSA